MTTSGRENSEQSEDLIILCLRDMSSAIVNHFSIDYYKWDESNEVKIFESLVLATFLLDYTLENTYRTKLSINEISHIKSEFYIRFRFILAQFFENKINYERVEPTIENRLKLYNKVLSENDHPKCWLIIASILTKVDYESEKNITALATSSASFPMLVELAKNTLKLTINC